MPKAVRCAWADNPAGRDLRDKDAFEKPGELLPLLLGLADAVELPVRPEHPRGHLVSDLHLLGQDAVHPGAEGATGPTPTLSSRIALTASSTES